MHKETSKPPCKHMEEMLQGTADGSLKGFKRWFTMLHVCHCGPCRGFLRSLEQIVSRLRGTREETMPQDREVLDRLALSLKKEDHA